MGDQSVPLRCGCSYKLSLFGICKVIINEFIDPFFKVNQGIVAVALAIINEIFTSPSDERTQGYITGRYG